MGRLTVRLPQTLHDQLVQLAAQEGVSLNQYIIYSLAQQATLAYTVRPERDTMAAQQRAEFAERLRRLGRASFAEVQALLAEREQVEPERDLTPEIVERLRDRIASKQATRF
jgi:acetylornithine deacetylase/succinyl-diaminopimelate desuccinylase-like protein